jgi:peptidoglycan/LPS O-acetylase OafA/YrhL
MPRLAQTPSSNHLASLDGLRALSIVMVLVCHGAGAYGHRSNDVLDYFGHLGVSIFFVISGTLITWLMIREKEETGSMSLRSFYIRRALRIIPVFWLFTLCVIALKSIHAVSISNLDILRAFTFTHNYPLL